MDNTEVKPTETNEQPAEQQTVAANDTQDNQLETALAKIAELEATVADYKDKMLRALAEADNTRRRAAKDKEDTAKFAVTSFARDIISVADNLNRALSFITAEQLQSDANLKNLYDGVQATERVLQSVFSKNNISKIEPMGEKFNPNFHEVMFEAPIPGKPHGEIIQLVEIGYMIAERLLRPAKVGIAKGDSDAVDGSIVDKEV